MIKSTAIDPTVVDEDGVYRNVGPARVFRSEKDAIAAIKSRNDGEKIKAGDIMVLSCGGPLGTGMEEVYQITAALKHLSYGKHVALITDARFSGVSTGACIGHVGPEALAGGPIGKVRDGDVIEIVIDRENLEGRINLVGEADENRGSGLGRRGDEQASRPHRPRTAPRASRRFTPVGGASERFGRHVGRLRVRRGRDNRDAGSWRQSVGSLTWSGE